MPVTYDHPRPAVTVDVAILREFDAGIQILLVRRAHEPYAGAWALPGGFVDENEGLEAAARRELREETGVEPPLVRQFRAYGDPGRDPRGHTVTIVYVAEVPADTEPVAGDDAREARWFSLSAMPALAFDHGKIIAELLAAIG